MVNRENVLKVADAIEKHSIEWLGFNMDEWAAEAGKSYPDRLDSCSTVACLAGWTYVVRYPSTTPEQLLRLSDDFYSGKQRTVLTRAETFLELTDRESDDLFRPSGAGAWNKIEPSKAVAVLRHLAETGVIDWSISSPDVKTGEQP